MRKRLILVDGMAVLYRSFYAIRELSTSSGRPTNAVYGFVRKLRELANSWDPTHMAVVFDGGAPEERLELLPDYKANRPPMPDPLREQIPLAETYLDCARVAWVRQERQEADDVLASVAVWAEPEAEQVIIAASDKDMFQLLNEKINMVPLSGKRDLMGPREVQAKTGVPPSQIVPWLALVGDNVDNIPGVPGVGPKTAARLLAAYPTLDDVWQHLDGIENVKLRTALSQHKHEVVRNVAMVVLNRELSPPFSWDDMLVSPPDYGKLLPFLEDLEFSSLVAELREQTLFPE